MKNAWKDCVSALTHPMIFVFQIYAAQSAYN